MWVLGIIAASLATTLLVLLLKGGIHLVGAVIGTTISAIIQALGLLISGVILAVGWVVAKCIIGCKLLYRKITTSPTDVDDDANFDWMKSAHLRDE